jgi:hypothetical protein
MGFSASVFAAAASGLFTFGDGSGIAPAPATYGLSNKVYLDYNAATLQQNYKLGCKHLGGNREFYTTNNTSQIFFWESDSYKGSTVLTNWGNITEGATTCGGTAL